VRLLGGRTSAIAPEEEDGAAACVLTGMHALKNGPMPLSSYKFGEFELDCARYELRRNDRVLKLERIPMELLILLAEKDGNVVSRQEIIERLWGKDVFVDTEHGINTAIRKIRVALREDAERPRFVLTVPGKGYRFVADKNGNPTPLESAQEVKNTESADAILSAVLATERHWWPRAIVVTAVCVLGVAVVGFNVAGFRDRIFPANPRTQIGSIAVLPLANLSGDPAQDYFADGMTDELITALAKNHSLRVVSRTSAMQYKGVRRPLRDIARELGVDGILEGSLERSGNRVHMTVQLIYGLTDTHVWAESYDRDSSEVFSLPSELSRTIAKEVKVVVSPASPQPNIKPEAHDEYLRGHYLWYSMDNENSRKHFEKAIQLQPDYAAAWSGVADDYIASVVEGLAPPEPALQKGGEAARKAVELDDAVAESHNSLAGFYLFGKWDWRNAEKESLRALELNPNLAEAHHLYSYVLVVAQRQDEAVREEKRSMELDPFAEPWALGLAYLQTRQIDAAIGELQLRAKAQPNFVAFFYLSEAYWLKGMWKESQQNLEESVRLTGPPEAVAAVHQTFEAGGERAVEEWSVKDITVRARKGYVSPFDIASRYACLGNKEMTLKYLEDAWREHSAWLVFIQNEPLFDFLHSDDRYRAIVKKMGLPPAS
jgi:TolB-like protein/DNA-binding winged helix-turn-helix (wHTH) protein